MRYETFIGKRYLFSPRRDRSISVITWISIGGVAPTGYLKNLKIVIDKSLSRFKYVYGAAGHPDCVFKITYQDLIKLTNGSEEEIAE